MKSINEKNLDKLLVEINRKATKIVNRKIIQLSINSGVNIKELGIKHTEQIDKLKSLEIEKLRKLYKKELKELELAIQEDKNKSKAKGQKKVKLKEGRLVFSKKDLAFIEDKYFNENLGYKDIATLMEKDAIKVRKIIALMMSEKIA